MEKREVAEGLSELENSIIGTFDSHLNYELQECDSSINHRMNRLENTLTHYRTYSPQQVSEMLRNFKSDLRNIKTLIAETRDTQRHHTVHNLQRVGIELEQAIKELEQFELEGIKPSRQDDFQYEDDVKHLIDAQVESFLKQHNITDERIKDEIKSEMKGLKRELVGNHDNISYRMRSSITSKVEMLGERLLAEKEQESIETKQSPISGLEGLVASEQEVANYDMRSQNEKAFKDEPTRDESSRKKYEDMFK